MPTITFSLKDLQNLVGRKLTIEEVDGIANCCKAEIGGYNKETDEVKIEFADTKLPYLWSIEGFARFIRGYLGIAKGIPQIKRHKSNYQLMIDKSILEFCKK